MENIYSKIFKNIILIQSTFVVFMRFCRFFILIHYLINPCLIQLSIVSEKIAYMFLKKSKSYFKTKFDTYFLIFLEKRVPSVN